MSLLIYYGGLPSTVKTIRTPRSFNNFEDNYYLVNSEGFEWRDSELVEIMKVQLPKRRDPIFLDSNRGRAIIEFVNDYTVMRITYKDSYAYIVYTESLSDHRMMQKLLEYRHVEDLFNKLPEDFKPRYHDSHL